MPSSATATGSCQRTPRNHLSASPSSRPQTNVSWKGGNEFRSIAVTGPAFEKYGNDELHEIGAIKFMTGECFGNPVMDFLDRKGTSTIARTSLKNPGWSGDSSLEVQVPGSNEMYAVSPRITRPSTSHQSFPNVLNFQVRLLTACIPQLSQPVS